MTPRFRNDPAALMLAVFRDLYPTVDVVLEYKPAEQMPTPASTPLNSDDGHGDEAADLPAAGCALFKADGSERPEIWLNIELPIEALPVVMAEELAHVVVGPDEQHGPAYQAVFEALQAEFERRAQRLLARLVPAATYHDQPTLLLANAVSQARYALEDLNLDPRAYQIVTSARELQSQRGRRVCRIGVPFPPEQEEEIQRLLLHGRHTVVFGL